MDSGNKGANSGLGPFNFGSQEYSGRRCERGMNRIGASRLYELSRVLDVPVSYFFEGLEGSAVNFGFFPIMNDAGGAREGNGALSD